MKKTTLSLLLAVALLTAANAQVIITEIMYNPPESNTDSLEYFELYNNSGATVDISGWNFTQGVTHVFPAGTIMPAGGYITLAKNANAFNLVFGFQPIVWTDGALTNSPGEDIELSDANGNVIDVVNYMRDPPWPGEEVYGMGSSLVLCDYNSDNNVGTNWIAATTGTGVSVNGFEVKGNPNAVSGCQISGNVVAVADDLVAPTGQTTLLDVLNNDLFVGTVTSLTISAQPTHGTATVVGNRISYTPNAGYCGADQLQYVVNNATSSGTAAVAIEVRCYATRSIESMTGENATGVADSLNNPCELMGVVYGGNIRPLTGTVPSLLFTIIDPQGHGIAVSSLSGNFSYSVQEKDMVKVRGVIRQTNGLTEIRPDTIIKVSSNNPLLNPLIVGIHTEFTESKLIRINNVRLVDNNTWSTGMGTSGFNARAVSDDNPLDTILIRIDRDVETYNAPVPPQPFNLTGIGGQFDSSSPFTADYQILPRYDNDISTLSSTIIIDFKTIVTLSPNPATDMLVIDMISTFDRVSILTESGRRMKTFENPDITQKVDVSLYPSGTYLVRFEKGKNQWTTKFVKI